MAEKYFKVNDIIVKLSYDNVDNGCVNVDVIGNRRAEHSEMALVMQAFEDDTDANGCVNQVTDITALFIGGNK